MPHPFFSSDTFGWTFCGLLWFFAAAVAVKDTLTSKIPNKWVVPGAALGLILNAIRGGLLAQVDPDHPVFKSFTLGSGIADGVLFSLMGFVFAFAGVFVFWILGLSGGGDVKHFAAMGAWLGWNYVAYVWMLSVLILWVWVIVIILARGLKLNKVRASIRGTTGDTTRRRIRPTYSVPIFLASIAVCLTYFSVELGLKTPSTQAATPGAGHAPLAAIP